jgi:hypothetical protein
LSQSSGQRDLPVHYHHISLELVPTGVKFLLIGPLMLRASCNIGYQLSAITKACCVGLILAGASTGGFHFMNGRSKSTAEPIRASVNFEPDILVAYQFAKASARRDRFNPEEKLMFAVLADAIECFQRYVSSRSHRCRMLFQEAEAWILSRESRWPFSFEQICEALHISPSYLRQGLMRWSAQHQASKHPQKRLRESLRYQYRLRNPRITA